MSNDLFQVNTVYDSQIENFGWLAECRNGETSGSEGKGLRMEAFRIHLEVPDGVDLHVTTAAHVENIGWMSPVPEGEICGTVGQSLELQAVVFQLNGTNANEYDIWVQLHVEDIGWMNWMKTGECIGTVGKSLRAEAMRVMVFKKGVSLKTDNVVGFIEYVAPPAVEPSNTNDMVSPHFSRSEIACDCAPWKEDFGWCDGYPEPDLMTENLPYLLSVLETIRNYFETPVIITSMIRCDTCNDHFGGVAGSYHKTWQAVDIVVPGVLPEDVALMANGLTGCGARYYVSDGFTHLEPPGCGVYCQQS